MRALFVLPLLLISTACSNTPPPKAASEDDARKVAPLPACVLQLPPRKSPNAGVTLRSLKEEQYWQLAYPSVDEKEKKLGERSDDCTGKRVFDDPLFIGATPARPWPMKLEEGDISYASGADRLKAAWLRSHVTPDGKSVGILVLTRTLETHAELYALGVVKGNKDKTRISFERIGPEVVITLQEDTCAGRAKGAECETMLSVLLPRRGRLVPIAEIPTERLAFAVNSEPGMPGRIEYHLTTAVEFTAAGIKIQEQIKAKTLAGAELRKVELDRLLRLSGESSMKSSLEPMWPRVVVGWKGKGT